jgi:hypothetical protein
LFCSPWKLASLKAYMLDGKCAKELGNVYKKQTFTIRLNSDFTTEILLVIN